jgi:phosphonate transport system substrate-binding protein
MAMLVIGCSSEREPDPVLDFNELTETKHDNTASPTDLRVAVAAMTGPRENHRYYSNLVNHIAKEVGVKVSLVQRKTYSEVNRLIEMGDVDLAFLCSGGYVKAVEENCVELLCAPVIDGKVTYQSYVIVPHNATDTSFLDLRGKTFAYTDPMSNTGCLYPSWLLREAGYDPDDFFERIVFTHGHDNSIYSVVRRIVDGAAVDGLVYEYLRKRQPLAVTGIRILHKSREFGIPPVVTRKGLDPDLREELLKAMVSMDEDSLGASILAELDIDQFVEVDDSLYNSVRTMADD